MTTQISFRASRFSDLCGSVSKSELTVNQEIQLRNFYEQENSPINRKPLTDKQREEMNRLIAKRDAPPELDLTAKAWVEEIFDNNVRGLFYPNVSSMETEHGNYGEKEAINLIAKVNGWGMCVKSKSYLHDEHGDGHPDVYKQRPDNKGMIGFDAKCSFTGKTFPLWLDTLKESAYIWQAKRYAMMSGLDHWYICYALINASDETVMKHAKKLWEKAGYSGYMKDGDNFVNQTAKHFYDEVKTMHTFDHLQPWERVKTFKIDCTEQDRQFMAKRAGMGRDYYQTLLDKYETQKPKLIV